MLWIVLAFRAFPQGASTQGKEFWLSFMQNGYYENTTGNITEGVIPQIIISAKQACQVSITNPNHPEWSLSFPVEANSITQRNLPKEYCYHMNNQYETVSDKGIHIVATETVSVYCANIANYSFDASFVLPIESLGDNYLVQCGDQSTLTNLSDQYKIVNQTSAFLIVAAEDNTTVHITPTMATLGGHPANTTFEVTLNAGQTYHVRSNNNTNYRDLSGTIVRADGCKKIAVFNGNTLTRIPLEFYGGNTGLDHIFEQAMPTRSWGKRFVVTQSMTRNRDFVKVISAVNNNEIRKNGQVIVTLNANQSHLFELSSSEGSCYLESSQPCAVYLYNTSANDGKANGDPSMVWIAPIEQCIDEVTFATFTHQNASIDHHHVNIIVKAEDAGNVYFDGNQLSPSEFTTVNGNANYKYTRKTINHGTHRLSCANGFNAHVYGFGDAKGYAYLVGSNAIDLSTIITVNGLEISYNEDFPYCAEEPVIFSAEVNLQDYQLLWDFGDGTTSTQNPATHIYHENRRFQAMLIVTTDESGCEASASDTTLFYIDTSPHYVNENDEACEGSYYSGFGFNNILIFNDTVLIGLQPNPINPQCDDSLLVHIHAHQSYHFPFTESRCWTGQPGFYDEHGFSFTYSEPGPYHKEQNLVSIHGCDSIITLDLTVAERITHEFDTLSCTGFFIWDGREYDEGGVYDWSYVTPGGCDSIVTMHLTLGTTQFSSFDTIACGTFYWNGQTYEDGGSHQQTLQSHDGCDSIVTCNLTLNKIYDIDPDTISACDNHFWNGILLTADGLYTDTLLSVSQCDSIVHLYLNLNHTPDPTDIQPVGNTSAPWVIPATEFQINAYEFVLSDNQPNNEWDSVSWQLCKRDMNTGQLVPSDINWRLLEKGALHDTCKVYVIGYITDTVWLRATVYNGCASEGIQRDYWMVCSFYGLEHPEKTVSFDVVPNPNNGQMELRFEHISGKLDIKVYDMLGVLIDQFQAVLSDDKNTLSYNLKGHPNGIYLFVVSTKEGVTARKVSVSN